MSILKKRTGTSIALVGQLPKVLYCDKPFAKVTSKTSGVHNSASFSPTNLCAEFGGQCRYSIHYHRLAEVSFNKAQSCEGYTQHTGSVTATIHSYESH